MLITRAWDFSSPWKSFASVCFAYFELSASSRVWTEGSTTPTPKRRAIQPSVLVRHETLSDGIGSPAASSFSRHRSACFLSTFANRRYTSASRESFSAAASESYNAAPFVSSMRLARIRFRSREVRADIRRVLSSGVRRPCRRSWRHTQSGGTAAALQIKNNAIHCPLRCVAHRMCLDRAAI